MRAVDEVMLEQLRLVLPPIDNPDTGVLNESRVHDGEVVVDNKTKVVSYALPYVVYTSNLGDDDNPRLSGRNLRRSVFMSMKFVGEDRNQVKWAMQRVRDQIDHRVIPVPDHKVWPVQLQVSTRVFRDDDAMRPNGAPLFYAEDQYDMSVMLKTVPAMIGATP